MFEYPRISRTRPNRTSCSGPLADSPSNGASSRIWHSRGEGGLASSAPLAGGGRSHGSSRVYKKGVLVRGYVVESLDCARSEPVVASELDFAAFFETEVQGQVKRAALLLGSVDAANDVVQDAFVAVFRHWGTLDSPGPYLNRAVLNGCRDHARGEARLRRFLPRLVQGDPAPTAEPLTDVLARLPFNHRAAVVLKYWGRLSTRQIAEQLDCAPGSVGPWIDRALKRMRKELS